MDYSKLSQVTDSAKGKEPKVSVEGLQVEDQNESVLDKIKVEKKKVPVTDSKKPQVEKKVVFIDDAFIAKTMSASRTEKRQTLSKLSDAQRRRFLERWAEIKDDSVDKLTLVNVASLIQNAAFSPTKYNKDLLQDFIDNHKGPEFETINKLGELIISGEVDLNDESQKEVLDDVTKILEDAGVQNSIRQAVSIAYGVSDSVDLPEEVIKEIESDTVELAQNYAKGEIGLTQLINTVDDIIASCSPDYEFSKVEALVNDKFNTEIEKYREQKVKDSVIDKIAESELLDEDGNPVETGPKPTVLELLSEAIEEFANGNEDKLQNLAKIEVDGATVSLDVSEKEDEVEEPEGSEEPEDTEEEIDLGLEESEDLVDSVDFARALLKKDFESVARISDKLQSKVPQIKKYGIKVVDCGMPDSPVYTPQAAVVNPPLTHDEFYSIEPQVPYVTRLAKQQNPVSVPVGAEIVPHENYIDVTAFGNTQKWVPVMGSVEDLGLGSLETPQEIADKISTDCVPVYDTLRVASATNNLNFIDGKFYKKHLSDSYWSFDEVPACVNCEGADSNCVMSQTQFGEVVGTIDLFGTPYYLVRI